MATCRRCFNSTVNIPASPRPIDASSFNKENSMTLSNMLNKTKNLGDKSLEFSQKLYEHDASKHSLIDDIPAKKALFDETSTDA